MAHSITMTANPAAGTFPDFLTSRFGQKYVVAPRMTDRLRLRGYERAITRKQYDAAERDWETLAYGAPLKSLESAAPDLLSALRGLLLVHRQMMSGGAMPADTAIAFGKTEAAIAKAEGRA